VPPFDRTRRTSRSQPRMQRRLADTPTTGESFLPEENPETGFRVVLEIYVIKYSLKYYVTVKEKYTCSSFFRLAYAFYVFDVLAISGTSVPSFCCCLSCRYRSATQSYHPFGSILRPYLRSTGAVIQHLENRAYARGYSITPARTKPYPEGRAGEGGGRFPGESRLRHRGRWEIGAAFRPRGKKETRAFRYPPRGSPPFPRDPRKRV